MRAALTSLLFFLLALCATEADALVNPDRTSLPVQSWMAEIHVKGRRPNTYSIFCHGALIAPSWVLTSARCLYDPFKALDNAGSRSDPGYAVRIGGSTRFIDVERFVQSPDFTIGLMKLAEPAPGPALGMSTLGADVLLGRDLDILASERSLPVRDDHYQPGEGTTLSCSIDGQPVTSGGARCYLLGKMETRELLYRTTARVIDPNAGDAPRTALDGTTEFDTSGSRLYLDLSAGSYPCHEDIGAPLLLETSAGTTEVAGVITGVGIAAGYPMCTTALGNLFHSIAPYRDFIDATVTQDAFTSVCPRAPRLTADRGEHGVRLSWEAVPHANGYRVHYTFREGVEEIRTVDVGNRLIVNTALEVPNGSRYAVALSAYNENCSSELSKPVQIFPN